MAKGLKCILVLAWNDQPLKCPMQVRKKKKRREKREGKLGKRNEGNERN
jgi:hypothetical protein